MESSSESRKSARKRPTSKADFIRRIGIGPDLARFLTDFTERPEILSSLPSDKYREFESQIDAIFSSLGKR
jgi:hypothetical protein